MPNEFKSWNSYLGFRKSARRHARYILERDSQEFLNAVRETSTARVFAISAGQSFFRAQLGHDDRPYFVCPDPDGDPIHVADELVPYGKGRMCPFGDRAHEGRANPKGIPVFYCASDVDTAVSEVRPWIGSFVSVATFTALRALRVVNCADNSADPISIAEHLDHLLHNPAPETREKVVWQHIDEAFSEPVTMSDDIADYAPTQILAEVFREQGYDGIGYKSSVGDGTNFALFDPTVVNFETSWLVKVTGISVTSERPTPPIL